MRVVVVGTGVMGLSAAHTLAGRGHDVLALDKFGVGNPLASSSGDSRIWRIAHPDRVRVRLAQQTIELWRDLERRSGEQLLLQSGLLWRGGDAAEVAAALEAEGVEHELVDEERQAELFPELSWRPDLQTLWQPLAGTVLADRALSATARLASRAGAQLVEGVSVTSVEARRGGGVAVVTERGVEQADVAVVTAGPWAGPFLQALGIPVELEAVLSQVSYIGEDTDGYTQRPCFVDVPPEGGSFGFYSLPVPGVGYKVAIDDQIAEFDAESNDRLISPSRESEVAEIVRRELPGFDPTILHSNVCTWTSSPDDLFVVDRIDDVVVGFGDSGQGFKFHPWFGPVLADLVEGQPLDPDVERFRAARFA